MTTADAVIAWEQEWLGYQEPADTWVVPFQFPWYPNGDETEWCGLFQMKAVLETGGTVGNGPSDTIPNTAWTVAGVRTFQSWGRWKTDDPQRGDIVYFDWQGGGLGTDASQVDHVGIVEDPSAWPNSIVTIEGNVNEAVGRFRRYPSQIVGFGSPRYGTAAPVQTLGPIGAGIQARYNALSASQKAQFGERKSGEVDFPGSYKVRVAFWNGGAIAYYLESGRATIIYGAIYTKWLGALWSGQNIGAPVADEENGTVSGTRISRCQTGAVVWSPEFGAKLIYGSIYAAYLAYNPAVRNALGKPLSDEIDTEPKGGRWNWFERGAIIWHPAHGTRAVYGGIWQKYVEVGGTKGFLGFPASDEADYVVNGKVVGRQQLFSGGSVYWTPQKSFVAYTSNTDAFYRANANAVGAIKADEAAARILECENGFVVHDQSTGLTHVLKK